MGADASWECLSVQGQWLLHNASVALGLPPTRAGLCPIECVEVNAVNPEELADRTACARRVDLPRGQGDKHTRPGNPVGAVRRKNGAVIKPRRGESWGGRVAAQKH